MTDLQRKRDALIDRVMTEHTNGGYQGRILAKIYKQTRLQALRDAFPLNPGGVALLIAETEAL